MFRRRREPAPADGVEDDFDDDFDDLDDDDAALDADDDGAADRDAAAVATTPKAGGPWDIEDAPTEWDVPLLDFGGLIVPALPGFEIGAQVEDEVMVMVTVTAAGSQLQLQAFAAPKSGGLWAEVRDEIAASVRNEGGTTSTADGPFGPELRAQVPTDQGRQPARFIGVDGRRWFLRGLLIGAAAADATQARRFEDCFRTVIVNRGGDAMAPRDLIPLHLPRDAEPVSGTGAPSLELPQRGPEITETR
ncbi:MAG TPA: DUF3710 domain-containing protein [Mycobacteriales bacterium]|nr:DUF3710 domain-containing protein [Mycobacteriales bacterium]